MDAVQITQLMKEHLQYERTRYRAIEALAQIATPEAADILNEYLNRLDTSEWINEPEVDENGRGRNMVGTTWGEYCHVLEALGKIASKMTTRT